MDCFDFDLASRDDPPHDSHDTAPPAPVHTADRETRGRKQDKGQNKFRLAQLVRGLQTELEAMKAKLEITDSNMQCQVSINEIILGKLDHASPLNLQWISDTATAESQKQISLNLNIQNLLEAQNALCSEVQSLARSREVAEANLNKITKLHLDFHEHLKAEAEKINMIEQACRASINQMHLRHQEHLKTEAEKLDRLQKEMHALQRGYNTA